MVYVDSFNLNSADAVGGKATTQRLVVSVMGGSVNVAQVRDLKGYPRLPILTVAELLDGRKRPGFPDMAMGTYTFKKAKRERLDMAAKTPNLFTTQED